MFVLGFFRGIAIYGRYFGFSAITGSANVIR